VKQSKKEEVGEAVKSAIATGYRHLDCAYIYDNETQIGSALKVKCVERICLLPSRYGYRYPTHAYQCWKHVQTKTKTKIGLLAGVKAGRV